ncbi:hypothetical protein IMZ31_23665 (plasmid) [Pontibacillus sp. ALD_SL1]|uniref:hypothetical protein n=1 Tax=Pontibacillus sp. ALD_SL1 TaxID=2777185 RepID=UPI001A9596D0|nr:hypothetical protein [Pontibacillus sp. ALD_SL1]QST02450.1 hypothetical protein IMZ31_23665 [Pontibacillus sp. ALD_SL1]
MNKSTHDLFMHVLKALSDEGIDGFSYSGHRVRPGDFSVDFTNEGQVGIGQWVRIGVCEKGGVFEVSRRAFHRGKTCPTEDGTASAEGYVLQQWIAAVLESWFCDESVTVRINSSLTGSGENKKRIS